ncbi:MAG: hypothetical protein PHU72_02410 [Dethiosulfovibrio sp.]|nr:hypothetical protein [Dethiosulfovibrio sp.]
MSVIEKEKALRSAENPRQVQSRSRGMVRHKVNVQECVKLFGVEVRAAVETEDGRIDG